MLRMSQERWDRRHLLGLDGLSANDLVDLLDAAEQYLPVVRGESRLEPPLAGRIIGNLFFEDSTRTRCSFTVAAQRLGALHVDLTASGSSVSKGESLIDTSRTIEAMGTSALVVRASQSGTPAMVARAVSIPVINAGDGRHEHPTQGLLDLLTIRQRLGGFEGRRVAIVGDIAASRVARSAMHGLTTLGASVDLIGPPAMVPRSFESVVGGPGRVAVGDDLDAVLGEIDAVMMLRVQFERGSDVGLDYRERYALTVDRTARLRPGAFVMHPGPMNRGLEIDAEVADDPERSVIRQQVTNGVAVRMAVLRALVL